MPEPDRIGPALERLAAAHGVLTGYDDWAGERVHVSAEAVVAVLGALGVDASDGAAVDRSLAAAEAAARARALPPTVVVTPGRRTVAVRAGSAPLVSVELDGGGTVPVRVTSPTGTSADSDGAGHEAHLPDDLPLGYHRLVVQEDGRTTSAHLVVAPDRCPGSEHLGRAWGWMVQLYAVRSRRSWGIGDYGDLAALAAWAGRAGADLVLCNPLHAASPTLPQVDSPYSPSSRRFRHTGGLRVDDIPEAALLDPAAAARLKDLARTGAALNDAPMLDRDAVARLQREALELVRAVEPAPERAASLDAFRTAGGATLDEFAVWCALAETHGSDWTRWPEPLRRPDSPAVAAAAEELRDLVDLHVWLQWLCDEQLAGAQQAALGSGQRIGVIHDLAVGVTPTGADAWALQDVVALGATVGAPPDSFNQRGQDWALPPMRPDRLAESGYAPYRDMLRAVLRHAGGIRIDHAMGLFRLYWIPAGLDPTRGAYVRYPAEDLLAILALEAHLAGAVVIAEDLGTVEEGVPETLARWGIHGSAVLWFERDDETGEFTAPADYREDVFASVTTHDLPTAVGFWTGEATRVRAELGQLGEGRTEEAQVAADDEERAALRSLLDREGLLPDADPAPAELAVAVQRLVLRSHGRLVGLALSDAISEPRQPNLPGTTDAYPNWRLPLAESLEGLTTHPGVRRLVEIATAERPRPV